MLEQGANLLEPGTNDEEDRVHITSLSTILASTDEESTYELPKHYRCAAHTLNLVATVDSEKAFSNSSYKKVNRSAFGKAVALWNKQQRCAWSIKYAIFVFRLNMWCLVSTTICLSLFRLVRRLSTTQRLSLTDLLLCVCNRGHH